ncbi:hypothetical protein GNI_083220, partial [Gregarina niphandrodes]
MDLLSALQPLLSITNSIRYVYLNHELQHDVGMTSPGYSGVKCFLVFYDERCPLNLRPELSYITETTYEGICVLHLLRSLNLHRLEVWSRKGAERTGTNIEMFKGNKRFCKSNGSTWIYGNIRFTGARCTMQTFRCLAERVKSGAPSNHHVVDHHVGSHLCHLNAEEEDTVLLHHHPHINEGTPPSHPSYFKDGDPLALCDTLLPRPSIKTSGFDDPHNADAYFDPQTRIKNNINIDWDRAKWVLGFSCSHIHSKVSLLKWITFNNEATNYLPNIIVEDLTEEANCHTRFSHNHGNNQQCLVPIADSALQMPSGGYMIWKLYAEDNVAQKDCILSVNRPTTPPLPTCIP